MNSAKVDCRKKKLINDGFETCGHIRISKDVESRVKTCHNSWKKSLLFTKYPTDGIVVRLADRSRQERAERENKSYDWKIAIKDNW